MPKLIEFYHFIWSLFIAYSLRNWFSKRYATFFLVGGSIKFFDDMIFWSHYFDTVVMLSSNPEWWDLILLLFLGNCREGSAFVQKGVEKTWMCNGRCPFSTSDLFRCYTKKQKCSWKQITNKLICRINGSMLDYEMDRCQNWTVPCEGKCHYPSETIDCSGECIQPMWVDNVRICGNECISYDFPCDGQCKYDR